MEASPLTRAHDHAHAAAAATRQASDTTVAINEHTQAAGEFANAAGQTSSIEALRTLKLLEEHHRRLAEILKLPQEQTSQTGEEEEEDLSGEKPLSEKGGAGAESENARRDAAGAEHENAKTAQMPGMGSGSQRRFASREMSSSIASNLASARGIRSKYRGQQLSPSVSNDQAPGNVDAHPRRDGKSKMQNMIDHQSGKPGWVPPMPATQASDGRVKSARSPRADASPPPTEDAGYARFYNTFGSLINKISAPLAFAGLPLISEEPSPATQPAESPAVSSPRRSQNPPRPSASVTLDPDLSKIYSKATLRALAREGQTAADSFYVVPTSGHTMSYANILSYAEKEKRRLGASAHGEPFHAPAPADDDDDDFVDARETPTPHSPGLKRRTGKAKTERELNNTIEELALQNKSLKDMLDKLTKRLHAFEASAQSSAMALAESYRMMRPGSPTSSGKLGDAVAAASSTSSGGGRAKTHELEEQLAAATKQMERLEKDNRKMQKTLEKYREKWDVLKAGAKARREAQGTGESVEDARQG